MVWYGYQLLKLGFIVIVDIVPGSRSHPNDGVVGRGLYMQFKEYIIAGAWAVQWLSAR